MGAGTPTAKETNNTRSHYRTIMQRRELLHETLVTAGAELWPEVMEDLKPPECESPEAGVGDHLGTAVPQDLE